MAKYILDLDKEKKIKAIKRLASDLQKTCGHWNELKYNDLRSWSETLLARQIKELGQLAKTFETVFKI